MVVVVGVAGRNVFHDSFGQRQIDPAPLPATPETIYDLASLTKALVTSLLAMRAVAGGRLSLHDPLMSSSAVPSQERWTKGSSPTTRSLHTALSTRSAPMCARPPMNAVR